MEDILPPSWMNESFFIEVLSSKAKQGQTVEVLKWKVGSNVPGGYVGILKSVEVHYKTGLQESTQSIRLIVKIPMESGLMREVGDIRNLYKKEVMMYRRVLPKMYEQCSWRMTAESFSCPLEDSVVLEDLRASGYKIADRWTQLDVSHCRQLLIKLSRLHALSVRVHHSHPDIIEAVGEQVFFREDNKEKIKEENILKFFLNGMIYTVKSLPGCEQFVEKIRNKVENCYDLMSRVYKPSDGLNVLAHGDVWTNNLLFKYSEDGEVIDVKFIDFQLCKFCSFAHDIHFFWWSSANEEVRENHREEMFELYRENLNQTLEYLECKERLSKEEFNHQMKICAPFSLQVVANFMNSIMSDEENCTDYSKMSVDDFDNPIDENSQHMNNFRSKYYKAVLPAILRQMDDLNVFDL